MGWAAVGWLGAFYRAAGAGVLLLIIGGGLCYTIGAVVYGRKRPDPSPAWFGFHEIFHACTIAGFVCHYIAISLTTPTPHPRAPSPLASHMRQGADERTDRRQPEGSWAARSSVEVTGSLQTKCWQT